MTRTAWTFVRIMLLWAVVQGAGSADALAQSDDARGYAAGKAACRNGPPSQYPGPLNSPGFTSGWQRGCREALSAYYYSQGRNDGYRLCQTNPAATSPNPGNLDYTRGFLEGCRLAPKPQPQPNPNPGGAREVRVASVEPGTGTAAGGTGVRLRGEGFAGATAVKFGDLATAAFKVDSDNQITATTPAGTPGTVAVTVTAGAKTSALGAAAQFTYQAADGPTVPPPANPPPPPPGGSVIGGINCDDPEIPRLWKTQVGCPGFAPTPAPEPPPPQVNPPTQNPTPPAGPPPPKGNVIAGINCDDPEIPRLWKTQVGCPGFGATPPIPVPPPPAADPPAGPGGSIIGVTLTLRFNPGEAIGGYTGYVIVPAQAARDYRHNGPLPPGSIQGVAWSTGPNLVTLNTTRFSGLESGRQYVVFLMFTGETVPVAMLDLPPMTTDYTGVLDATLTPSPRR